MLYMNCQYCNSEYVVKEKYIAKKCMCDEEQRMISFDLWYEMLFNISYHKIKNGVF